MPSSGLRGSVRRAFAILCLIGVTVSPVLAQSQANPPAGSGDPAQQAPPPGPETVQVAPRSELGHTGLTALFFDTIGDFKHFATDKEPLLWLAGGGATALAFHPLDDTLNERLAGDGSIDGFFKPGEIIGYGWVQIGTAIGTWGIGRMVDKRGRAAHIGLDLLRAQIVTQTVTYGLKYTVRRERPDGSGGYSFPSGHSSTTFATASVLERHFGWKAGIPTYLVATYVATSRLHDNRHYLSDVIFGGAVGIAAGRTVTRHGRRNFALLPMMVPGGYGIAVVKLGP